MNEGCAKLICFHLSVHVVMVGENHTGSVLLAYGAVAAIWLEKRELPLPCFGARI